MRLFVGVEIPGDIAAELYPLARGIKGLDAQTPENMHITLKFIGNVDPGLAEEIDQALAQVSFEPFDLQVQGLDVFASSRKIRIFWAGVKDQPVMRRLAQRVENALLALDDCPELDARKFTPHITLGRNREAARATIEQAVADHVDLTSRVFTIDRFCLYESHSTSDGPEFRVIAAYDGSDAVARSFDRVDEFATGDFE
ncbi:RNA 2',3'-cyclic phosphodiesterase [Thalassospira aquimaris]|uniref:RNA 2',3'-cyclic phosphodiesterase n=1 Tax=Thalassospira aquimaris TaxID=3037796 RepID=A0ABT6GHF8_9PROT|nr:RNA 2',3'-cyclic phosphodiesterase [Thalassospira sp. FZY0004]MDG4721455.1 RNA 2',3'-cyclic phosphodiesterase [Thalassospira sp. FZY0004]